MLSKPIFSRDKEKALISDIVASDRAELVAVYGRRRVGKTYLTRNTLLADSNALYLQLTGRLDNDKPISEAELLSDARLAFFEYTNTDSKINSIEDLFKALITLNREAIQKKKKLFLFFDEIPWLAQASSDFYSQFSGFWNNILEKYDHVKVFLTGSATSWMMNHVINAKGGLAKRVTRKIYLRPFYLGETQQFLQERGADIGPDSLLELYSSIGGIPYYLMSFDPCLSVRENLYQLLIDKDGLLQGANEYIQLFRYLFQEFQQYKKIVGIVGQKRYGMTLSAISKDYENKENPSGNLRLYLDNLVASNILQKRTQFLNTQKGQHYFVEDEYIRFFSRWLESQVQHIGYPEFSALFDSPAYRSWSGFNFELICHKHIHAIKQALGIQGIAVSESMYYKSEEVQIDLLLDRGDKVITLCEAKNHSSIYEPSDLDVQQYQARKASIESYLKQKRLPAKQINYCFITTQGVKRNQHFSKINPLTVSLGDIITFSK